MANDLAPSGERNTPWWYETPSLVSQSSHMTAYTGSNDSNPFDITPSVSSGYFDEDDGSNISDGSFTAHNTATSHNRAGSSWSNSTLTSGRNDVSENGMMMQQDLSGTTNGTLVATDQENGLSSNFYVINTAQSAVGGGTSPQGGTEGDGARGRRRGIPVAPLKLDGDGSLLSKAFTNVSTKGKDESQISSQQQRKEYENTTIMTLETSSPLCHSMSATNQEILRYLAPTFMQNINAMDLLPHLQRHNLLSDDEIDYIYDPSHSERDKIKKILLTAPSKNADAFDSFAECLEADGSHKAHVYLAKRLREAIEKKRLYPFKRLSSMRQKGHHSHNSPNHDHTHNNNGHTHNNNGHAHIQSRRHGSGEHVKTMPHMATTPDDITARASTMPPRPSGGGVAGEEKFLPQIPPKLRRHHKTLSNGGQSMVPSGGGAGGGDLPPVPPHWTSIEKQQAAKLSQSMDTSFESHDHHRFAHDHGSMQGYVGRGPRRSYDYVRYDPAPGNFSSLPRTHSQTISDETRGTKPYSSARYPSSTHIRPHPPPGTPEKRKSSLGRNASFHGMGEREKMIIVSPLDRNPAILSEETDDDSYLYRKAADNASRNANYENMRRSSDEDRRRANYKNVNIVSMPLPSPPKPHPHSRRTHDVILEDPAATTGALEQEHERFQSNIPRHVPSRSQSMHIHGDRKASLPHPSLPRDYEWKEKATCLRRGSSLHGHADIHAHAHAHADGHVQGHADGHGHGKTHSPGHQSRAEFKGDSAATPFPKQHRRTRSHDTQGKGMEESGNKAKRRASEYYPRETGEEGEGIGMEASCEASAVSDVRQDLTQQKLFKKKIQWLQQKVKFKDFAEEVKFDSQTRYSTPRDIIYSGTLYERGKPRFVILMTDMLLIIKSKKKVGKIGNRQQQFIDWFTEIDCKTKRPLMLHLLSVQAKSRRTSSESFSLHFNKGSTLVRISLQAVSNEAKNIWLDNLSDAIRNCTRANAECTVPVRYSVGHVSEGPPHTTLSLTIVEANNIAYSANVTTKNHYCSIQLGDLSCRTPPVKAKCWPTWNFKCDFVNFDLNDVLRVNFHTERITSPDDFLGYVEVNLFSASRKHHNQLGVMEMQLKNQHLPLRDGKGTLTVDFELHWSQPEGS